MIFKHKSTRRGYGGRILMLTQLCFLTTLIVRNVCAYPHENDQNEGNTVQTSDASSGSDRDQAQNDFEGSTKIDEQYDFRGRLQRDTSNYEHTDVSRSQQKGGPQHRQTRESDRIIFPTGQTGRLPSCKGSTYCEYADSYPEDVVTRALQRNETLKYLANEEVIIDIEQRINMDETVLCPSTEEIVYPREAMNKDNEWKIIINQHNFKQGVRVEKCSQESSNCKLINGFAQGYKTICKQKYVYKQLRALSANDVIDDNFKFPASCCCHVSFNGPSLTRIGLSAANSGNSEIPSDKTTKRT
ncbi:uncharacterized protein LOC143424250 [Xylocopa sonorina]|uniref:uncharacterized protein LOC143424250 n=1 Tax=Xylocopa sonorina TaxID=1818115 RepID=UPI00403ACF7E